MRLYEPHYKATCLIPTHLNHLKLSLSRGSQRASHLQVKAAGLASGKDSVSAGGATHEDADAGSPRDSCEAVLASRGCSSNSCAPKKTLRNL